MYTALRATTVTLADLLAAHLESDAELRDFFNPADGGTMIVSSATPQEMINDNSAGLSVWLYRIDRDDQLLNYPPRRIDFHRFERRRLPLRLHYLMTPIVDADQNGEGPIMEQGIIGKVLQTFHDHPLLSGAMLSDDLVGTGSEIAVRLETLGLEEITRVWDALESSYQLCISYEVTVVMVASDTEAADGVPVDVFAPEYGVATVRGNAP